MEHRLVEHRLVEVAARAGSMQAFVLVRQCRRQKNNFPAKYLAGVRGVKRVKACSHLLLHEEGYKPLRFRLLPHEEGNTLSPAEGLKRLEAGCSSEYVQRNLMVASVERVAPPEPLP